MVFMVIVLLAIVTAISSSSSPSSSSPSSSSSSSSSSSPSSTSSTPLSSSFTKVNYSIPSHLSINELKKYKKIKITSSHGRQDTDLSTISASSSSLSEETSTDSTSSSSSSSSSSISSISIKYKALKILSRAFYLFSLFLPVFLTSGLAYFPLIFRNIIWFKLLYKSIAYSGAAFIKWGQWASTRPDMFPVSLCNVLENLQSNSPQHSYSFTRHQIELELKAPIEEIFEKFDKQPIASGSIAQVYKAQLNGKDVAVKVRHPNVGEQIEIDFIIMKALATFIDSLPGLSWLNLKDSMTQFSDTISSQIRLDIEGRHLYQFNTNFGHWKDTKFPEPIIMTESVLVESFEEGQSVKTYADIFASKVATAITMNDEKMPTFDKTLAHFIVTRGEDIYLKMLLNDNLMHADLHPGNIIIRLSNSKRDKEKYKIVLVDAGMVAELLPEEQRNFIGLLESIGDGDGADAAECLLRFSSKASYSQETRKAFKKDIIEMFKTEARGYGNNVSIGKVLRGVLNIVRIHKVSVDANYATLVMNSLCLDGLAQSLYPRYNILDNAKPLLRLSRLSRKVIKNRKLSSLISKIFLPLAQWLKMRGDMKFLRKEIKNQNI